MSSLLPDHDEHLTTGWEPDLDAGDSIVRAAVLAHVSWAIAPARGLGRPWHDGAVWAGAHVADAGSLTNQVVLKQPLADLETVVAELDDFYPAEVPFLVVSAWPTGDLRTLGLSLVGHPPLMLRPGSPTDVAPSDLELRWAVERHDLVAAERVCVEGYPRRAAAVRPSRLDSPALTDASTRIVVAFDGDQRWPPPLPIPHTASPWWRTSPSFRRRAAGAPASPSPPRRRRPFPTSRRCCSPATTASPLKARLPAPRTVDGVARP